MSFSADQFIQVKCKFQLISETESSDSIHFHNEHVRLCTSVDVDQNSTLIVMICSNESGNNHIVAYYIERKTKYSNDQETTTSQPPTRPPSPPSPTTSPKLIKTHSRNVSDDKRHGFTFSQLANYSIHQKPNHNSRVSFSIKPRIIVKQIYYHNYNEDIVAICLSESGNKLALINASSTIYILPIKNILLNLHAKQLRSSQAESMYFYDASILTCCNFENPVAIIYWENLEEKDKSMVIVASDKGELSFIDVKDKKENFDTFIDEKIKYMSMIRDMFGHTLLITSENFNQYRFALKLNKNPEQERARQDSTHSIHPVYHNNNEYINIEKDIMLPWGRRPIPIKFNGTSSSIKGSAAAIIHRVLTRRNDSSSNTLASNLLERSSPRIFYNQLTDIVSLVDVFGQNKSKISTTSNRLQAPEPRLLRFFKSKQFYYKLQKPFLICKLTFHDPDEMITQLVLTDRLLAVVTNYDRCLISSKNCCNLKNSSLYIDLDPLVKEITFSTEEKILNLLKSPVSNDQDGIIESFLLVTNSSIYSIEARQSCRDMFINLIDTHLGIKPPRSRPPSLPDFNSYDCDNPNQTEFQLTIDDFETPIRRDSAANLLVNSFLCYRDEVYERVTYDSKAFSVLFKLDLNSLYEVYGDKLLVRNQFDLANRFFQMAKFDQSKILGKYIRLANRIQAISEPKYLEFITSSEVIKELVKDIKLASDHFSYPQAMIQFQRYSYTALHQLEAYRKLVWFQQQDQSKNDEVLKFSEEQKRSLEDIFIIYLEASLDESTQDSCRLWFNYINFYLNHVGSIEQLEEDIYNLLNNSNSIDCRLVVTLYMAICNNEEDESGLLSLFKSLSQTKANNGTHESTATATISPLESMDKLYNLSELFKNEFLLKLLEKTLDLIPHSVDLNALSDCCWYYFIEKGKTKELYSIA